MPTLSASNSVFQLAVAVNAVLPMLVSDFESVRDQAAESLLRKIKEDRPDFDLKERDREEFVSFTFQSTRGLRHAKAVTRAIVVLSLLLTALSLGMLCWSAITPDRQISVTQFFAFVGVTLVAAPAIYVARNRYLKWLYSILATRSSNEKHEAILFADCVKIYLENKKTFEQLEHEIDREMASIPLIMWRMRCAEYQMEIKRRWFEFLAAIERLWFKIH